MGVHVYEEINLHHDTCALAKLTLYMDSKSNETIYLRSFFDACFNMFLVNLVRNLVARTVKIGSKF